MSTIQRRYTEIYFTFNNRHGGKNYAESSLTCHVITLFLAAERRSRGIFLVVIKPSSILSKSFKADTLTDKEKDKHHVHIQY